MNLLDEIRIAQRDAGEAAVIANLERLGLVTPRDDYLELKQKARKVSDGLRHGYPTPLRMEAADTIDALVDALTKE